MHAAINLTLGNEAMATNADIAAALRKLAVKLDATEAAPGRGDERGIFDANGNRIGTYQIVRDA